MIYDGPNPAESFRDRINGLIERARHEFDEVSDFFWKAPRLVDQERELELEKLKGYESYPESRDRRWKNESRKLDQTFPYLIAVGNLFSALSLFETYVLMLVDELQPSSDVQLSHLKGNGISRLFAYFRQVGVKPENVPLYEQIQAAIKIRNCLAHASGMLSWSREIVDLRRIQSTGAYLSVEHRNRRQKLGLEFDEVFIEQSKVGERLYVKNEYCHILCFYLISYYSGLCELSSISFKTSGT